MIHTGCRTHGATMPVKLGRPALNYLSCKLVAVTNGPQAGVEKEKAAKYVTVTNESQIGVKREDWR